MPDVGSLRCRLVARRPIVTYNSRLEVCPRVENHADVDQLRREWSALPTHKCRLLDQFDLSRSPTLVEPGLKWAIQPKDSIPALTGYRLHPVAFVAYWGFRSEVDIV